MRSHKKPQLELMTLKRGLEQISIQLPAKIGAMKPAKSLCELPILKKNYNICNRTEFWQDLSFSGYYQNVYLDPKNHDAENLSSFSFNPQEPAKSQQSIKKLQLAYAMYKAKRDNETYFNYALWESLKMAQCFRVKELFLDAFNHKKDNETAWLTMAFCLELTGQNLKAVEFLSTKFSPKAAILDFHRARMLFSFNPRKAIKIAKSCQSSWPLYYPCFELHGQLLYQLKSQKTNIAEIFQKTNLSKMKDFEIRFLNWANFRKAGKAELAELKKTLYEFRRLNPSSFEAHAMAIISGIQLPILDSLSLEFFSVSNANISAELFSQLKDLLDQDTLLKVAKQLVSQMPENQNFWWQLVNIYSKGNQCEQVVKTVSMARAKIRDLPQTFASKASLCFTNATKEISTKEKHQSTSKM